MKQATPISIFLFFALFVFASCEEETCCDKPVEATNFLPPTSEAYEVLQGNALDSLVQSVSFNADMGLDFTSEKGAFVHLPFGCLTLNGELVLGEVKLEFIEIYNRSNMLPPNKSTMGLLPNADKVMLVSGGMFYINFTQNGQQLQLQQCELQLRVPTSLTGGSDDAMTLWSGNFDQNSDLTWEESTTVGVNLLNEEYSVFSTELGWLNIGRFYDPGTPKTTFRVLVTEGYTAENSTVYFAYSGEKHALGQLQNFDPQTNLFSEENGQIPIGSEVHLIFVTEENGRWRYAIKTVTISENEIYTIAHSETTVSNLQDFRNVIVGLP